MSICYLDVDRLRKINDIFGHQEGDRVLKTVSRALKETIRGDDIACRMGGDEFLLVLPQCSRQRAENVWKRIAQRIEVSNAGKKRAYKIGLSCGIVEYNSKQDRSVDQLLVLADKRMYLAKRSKY